MSDVYGVVPTGFRRKPLDRIQFEQQLAAQTIFGAEVILDPESPMGQLLGLFALLTAQLWEAAEATYQSYDPDQAEGVRLDTLARLRILARAVGEGDEDFRRAITNQDRARHDIQDLARAVRGLPDVTYAQVFVNDGNEVDENNLSPGTLSLAVIGGADEAIATEARRYIVPGVSTYGNVQVSTVIDGYCRSIALVRPILVPVTLTVNVRVRNDRRGCPPPSVTAVRDGLIADLSAGEASLLNGEDVTLYRVRSAVEARWPTMVEVVSMDAERDGGDIGDATSLAIGFIELATFSPDDVTVQQVV